MTLTAAAVVGALEFDDDKMRRSVGAIAVNEAW
jgi:hypothetical protein